MREIDYKDYQEMVMRTTDPIKGTKVAFLINDFHAKEVDRLKELLVDMTGIRLFIAYRKTKDGNGVIELDNLDEFAKAQSFAVHNSWAYTNLRRALGDKLIGINFGHADLSLLVDYSL